MKKSGRGDTDQRAKVPSSGLSLNAAQLLRIAAEANRQRDRLNIKALCGLNAEQLLLVAAEADRQRERLGVSVLGKKPAVLGRPRRGEVRLPTAVRSVRLPKALWKLVQTQARREHISINAALHQAAQSWVRA